MRQPRQQREFAQPRAAAPRGHAQPSMGPRARIGRVHGQFRQSSAGQIEHTQVHGGLLQPDHEIGARGGMRGCGALRGHRRARVRECGGAGEEPRAGAFRHGRLVGERRRGKHQIGEVAVGVESERVEDVCRLPVEHAADERGGDQCRHGPRGPGHAGTARHEQPRHGQQRHAHQDERQDVWVLAHDDPVGAIGREAKVGRSPGVLGILPLEPMEALQDEGHGGAQREAAPEPAAHDQHHQDRHEPERQIDEHGWQVGAKPQADVRVPAGHQHDGEAHEHLGQLKNA